MLQLQRSAAGPCARRRTTTASFRPSGVVRPVQPRLGQRHLVRTYDYDQNNAEFQEKLNEYGDKLKKWWEGVDDKPTFLLYSGVAVFGLVIINNVVNALEAVPLLPGLLRVVGLGYSLYFTYKYLLFAEGRSQLKDDFDSFKSGLKEQVSKGKSSSSADTKIKSATNDFVSKAQAAASDTRSSLNL